MAETIAALLAEIENGAVAGDLQVALRKCLLLGGRIDSTELRTWAATELKGYMGDTPLPEYRTIAAGIYIDGSTMTHQIDGQPWPVMNLPDFVQKDVSDHYEMRGPIAEVMDIVEHAQRSGERIKIGLPMSADLARVMSGDLAGGSRITNVYWSPHWVTLNAIVDAVRTVLVELVAELRAGHYVQTGDPEVASAAVSIAIHGSKNRVTVAQADGQATANVAPEDPTPPWFRTTVGLCTMVGAVAALVTLLVTLGIVGKL